MTAVQVGILAIVQGLTEFLPVSSSGHLLLARIFLGVPDVDGTAFDAFLHLGTLVALVVYYWRVWVGLTRELAVALVVATIPGALAGYFLKDVVDTFLRGPYFLELSFLFTAAVLWWFDSPARQDEPRSAERADRPATFPDALVIGLAQVLALVPAISRSAVTIAAGRARGFTRTQATTFSFLMSAPIIAGASLTSLGTLLQHGTFSVFHLVLGTVLSFLSGLLAISLLMRWVERMSFRPFAIYLIMVAVVVWVIL